MNVYSLHLKFYRYFLQINKYWPILWEMDWNLTFEVFIKNFQSFQTFLQLLCWFLNNHSHFASSLSTKYFQIILMMKLFFAKRPHWLSLFMWQYITIKFILRRIFLVSLNLHYFSNEYDILLQLIEIIDFYTNKNIYICNNLNERFGEILNME